jgi:S1-C subfamily serine protease
MPDEARQGLLSGLEVRRPKLSRSGFFVDSAGAVLTTVEAVDQCRRITIDRDIEADVEFADAALGVALVKPRTAMAPRAVAAFQTTARPGAEVAVAGFSYEDKLPAPTLTFGTLDDLAGLNGEAGLRRLTLAALPGDAGGPVFDGAGAVLGMLLPKVDDPARQLPAEVSFAAAAASLATRLAEAGTAAQNATPSGAVAPEDLTRIAEDMTVLVSCWN